MAAFRLRASSALDKSDPRYEGNDPRYKAIKDLVPLTENLEDTERRVLDYWRSEVEPSLHENRRVLIVAHGNTIRALVRYLDDVPGDGIATLSIPTGSPLVYELDDSFKPIRHYYLEQDRNKGRGCSRKQGSSSLMHERSPKGLFPGHAL